MRKRNRMRALRRGTLACTVIGALLAVDGRAAQPDRDWIRLRTDPALLLFPQLPAPLRGVPAPAATRATLPVTRCDDAGPGSLRDVVASAQDSDVVDLTALTCSTITLTTGAIEIPVDNLSLQGPERRTLVIDGDGSDRVLFHPHGGALTVRNLTLRNGRATAEGNRITGGGCIASAGFVVLQDSRVSGCSSAAVGSYGGGIYAYSLTMERSTLSANSAGGVHPAASTAAFGGGAFVYTMELRQSTVSDNLAWHEGDPAFSNYDIGGGIVSVRDGYLLDSTVSGNRSLGRGGGLATFTGLAVINSTISGNVAERDIAGGMFVRRPAILRLYSSTVTANRSLLDGGGIWLNAPGSAFHGSIVSGNSSDVGNRDNRFGSAPIASPIDGSHNLIGSTAPLTEPPADTLRIDARLGALASNGGRTRTHALLDGSPAIDAGSNHAALATDQRGLPRVYGAAPDIGAFERQGDIVAEAQPVPGISMRAMLLLAGLLGFAGMRRALQLRRR